MDANVLKSAVMVINAETSPAIFWGDSPLPIENCYTYLWVAICDNLENKKHTDKLLGKIEKRLKYMNKTMRKDYFALHIHVLLYTSLLEPVACFGSEVKINAPTPEGFNRVIAESACLLLGLRKQSGRKLAVEMLGLHWYDTKCALNELNFNFKISSDKNTPDQVISVGREWETVTSETIFCSKTYYSNHETIIERERVKTRKEWKKTERHREDMTHQKNTVIQHKTRIYQ